ncbi:MAG: carbonic anhydrase [Spirosomataceae bacterium]
MNKSYQTLLDANRVWAEETLTQHPEYFKDLAKSQKPEYLWIGCADSRAPADLLTNTKPGEIFVHRNVANLVIHTDLNMLSVLQYAVEVLKVKHIMVVGHTNCGGVRAAMGNKDLGLINKWLRNIKDVYIKYEEELDAIQDEDARAQRLTELNVREQVRNLAKTSIIQHAWQNDHMPYLHGWVLDLSTGLINTICEIQPGEAQFIEKIYRFDDYAEQTGPQSLIEAMA